MKVAIKIPQKAWIGIGAGAVVLYLVLILWPTLLAFHHEMLAIQVAHTKSEAVQHEEIRQRSMQKKVDQMAADVASFESRLPAHQTIESVMEKLSQQAIHAGVRITAIRPAPEVLTDDKTPQIPQSIYPPYPILVTLKAGYHELGQWLAEVEGKGTLFRIANLSIESDSDDESHHGVTCLLFTYLHPEGSGP